MVTTPLHNLKQMVTFRHKNLQHNNTIKTMPCEHKRSLMIKLMLYYQHLYCNKNLIKYLQSMSIRPTYTLEQLAPFHPKRQQYKTHYEHNTLYVTSVLNLHGNGHLPKLNFEGDCMDMLVRAEPFDENNEKREHDMKKDDDRKWMDKAIVFIMKYNPAFQNAEQLVTEFYESVKKYILSQSVRVLLTSSMREGMTKTKLVSKLEKKDADYWQMIKTVDPLIAEMESLDEVLADEAIKIIIQKLLNAEFNKPVDDLDPDLATKFYSSAYFPDTISELFQDE